LAASWWSGSSATCATGSGRRRSAGRRFETLAAIKNPPTVSARQANIANGPQQVNNGVPALPEAPRARALSESAPTELLEGHVERVDSGAPGAAGSSDPVLEAVAVLNRPRNGGR